MVSRDQFTFEISLSVLNHLGRHLYRSFVTILGEAISNSWDADAKNVWIYLDREKNSFIIKDDGTGMTANDFQNKFLNIGFSKRKSGQNKSPEGRPFIGRKGIGKLALLSCAEKITVSSKTSTTDYVGGTIDNTGLDQAINDELKPQQYPLGVLDQKMFEPFTRNHEQGTIIYFEGIKGGIRNTLGLLKKIIALYFRFSLIDTRFSIYLDGEKITYEHLKELAEATEFLWTINGVNDPYVKDLLPLLKEREDISLDTNIHGFVASVSHYKDLNIMNLDEKVGIDLFVNGRLRERDILKRVSKSRVVESYLYGQIHFNDLDDNTPIDRFTSSREGIVPDDPKYQNFLNTLDEKVLKVVISEWDKWRRKHREDGDSEDPAISLKDRKSEELFNAVSKEYVLPNDSQNKKKVAQWVNSLADDASFNFGSYAECFISENLIRKYIHDKPIPLTPTEEGVIAHWQQVETQHKVAANLNIDIRQNDNNLCLLDMDNLAQLVDPQRGHVNCLATDAKPYRPIRNSLMHTALLTTEAKRRLTTIYDNIKGRIKELLS